MPRTHDTPNRSRGSSAPPTSSPSRDVASPNARHSHQVGTVPVGHDHISEANQENWMAAANLGGIQRARGTGNGKGLERFARAARGVKHRNREFKALTRHAAEADVSTDPSGGVLWTGDKRDANDNVEINAMKTAQNYAEQTGKKTVEMTPGGGRLDRYTNAAGNSYAEVVRRFNYLADEERSPEHAFDPSGWSSAANLMQPTINASRQSTGDTDLAEANADAAKNPAANLWDVLSRRFAGGLEGDTVAVHGYDASQHDALTAGPLANNTFNGIEQPTVEAKGQAQIRHVFGDTPEMNPYLRDR